MFFRPKKVLGLDIGTSSIKLAELEVSSRGAKLINFGLLPTPSQSVVAGDLVEPVGLSRAVKELAMQIKTQRKKVAVGLWGSSIIVKRISIPRIDEKLVGEQLRWEAEQYVPFDMNEINIDFKILKTLNANSDMMDVLLVAAKQDGLIRYQEVIQAAGFESDIMDVGGFALANCYERNYDAKNETTLLLNIGCAVTNFVVYDKGEVVFCRDTAAGGLTYTLEIQKALSINLDEAEAMKLSFSRGQPVPDEVGGVVASTHDIICEEINSSLDFYLNTSSGGTISRCYITGGGSRTAGLARALTERLKINCDPLDPFNRIKYHEKSFTPDFISEIRDFAAISMGLGLRTSGDS